MSKTLAFTVGDLRIATTPQGSFPCRAGAALYGLCLGIPRHAQHIEEVTTDAPVVVHVDRDAVTRAERALALAEELAAQVGDEEILARLLERLKDGASPGPEAQAELERLRERVEIQAQELAAIGRERDAAESLKDKLQGDLSEYEELKRDHEDLRGAAEDLLSVLQEPLCLSSGYRGEGIVGGVEHAAREARDLVADLDKLVKEIAEDDGPSTDLANAAADAVERLKTLRAQRDEAKTQTEEGIGGEALDVLRGLGVNVISSGLVVKPVHRPAEPKGGRKALEKVLEKGPKPTQEPAQKKGPTYVPPPAPGVTRLWIAGEAWDALDVEDRETLEEPIGGLRIEWTGREGYVFADVDNAAALVCIEGVAAESKIALHKGDEAPVTNEKLVKKTRAPRVSRPKSHRQTPCPEADNLTMYGTSAAYLDGEGWHVEGRGASESQAAWDARVQSIARDPATKRVRTYDRAGKCTWDSLDTAAQATTENAPSDAAVNP